MSRQTRPIQPLISREMMKKIVSSQRSITSEEALEEMAKHTGKPIRSAKKATYRNGRKIWVDC